VLGCEEQEHLDGVVEGQQGGGGERLGTRCLFQALAVKKADEGKRLMVFGLRAWLHEVVPLPVPDRLRGYCGAGALGDWISLACLGPAQDRALLSSSSAAGWLPGRGEFLIAFFRAAAQVEVFLPEGLDLVVQRGDIGGGRGRCAG